MLSMLLALGPDFMKPEWWFDKAGAAAIWVVVAIIFAESGLLIGFFLPGDSLLFFTGFLTSDAALDPASPFHQFAVHMPPLPVVLLLVFVAAVAGDQVGYLFGKQVGTALFNRPNSKLFKQEHLVKAHDFFEHHGPKSIMLARFVPIVRTFTPIVAGVSDMHYRTFVRYNVIGGFVWAVGVTSLGHFLGNVEIIRDNIEYAIIMLVAVSILPMVIEFLRHRRNAQRAATLADTSSEVVAATAGDEH